MKEEDNLADYTVGIFQSIGFKEFQNYLKLGTEEQKGPLGQKLFEDGKEQMMLATRQVDSVVEFQVKQSLIHCKIANHYLELSKVSHCFTE